MKSLSGNYVNVPPAVILTGPIQETAADQLVASITPTLTSSVNPFSGRLRAGADANISDASWYVFADPARLPSFVYGSLGVLARAFTNRSACRASRSPSNTTSVEARWTIAAHIEMLAHSAKTETGPKQERPASAGHTGF